MTVKVKVKFTAFFFIVFTAVFTVRPDNHEPLWRFVTGGRIRSYPAVGRDGHVYLLSDDRFLYSLTRQGAQRWRYYLEERLTDCFALANDGTVYIGYKTGEFLAIHGYGRKIWHYASGQPLNHPPAVRRDGTICLAGDTGTLWALTHTGSLLWKRDLAGRPSAPPTADVDHSLYIGLLSGELVALHGWGEVKWRLTLAGTPSMPVIGENGVIYVGTSSGRLYAVDADKTILWSASFPGALQPPVIGRNGTIYVAASTGRLAALTPEGKPLWSLSLGETPSGSCLIGETGTIYIASLASSLFAIAPEGKIASKNKAKGVLTQLILSPQEILYAGSSDWAVYAFPGEKPAATAWPAYRRDAAHSGVSDRPYHPLSLEERYSGDPLFHYFRALLSSGNPELMEKGLEEIQLLVAANQVKSGRPYLLYLLGKTAGFTVIENDKKAKFPLRGYSAIRQEACRLYTALGGLEARPLLLSILKQDEDNRMKAVAVHGLGRLRSDGDGEAAGTMARLILADTPAARDNTFAREVILALGHLARYQGRLNREGFQALSVLSGGAYGAEVRALARRTLRELGEDAEEGR